MSKIELNGITIELKEGVKSPRITIHAPTDDVDIIFNDTTIFSGYEQEEFQYIPPSLRPFASQYGYSYESDIELNRKKYVGAELEIKGEGVTAFFPYNRKHPILFRVNNIFSQTDIVRHILPDKFDLGSYEQIQKREEANKSTVLAWMEVEKSMSKHGFQFKRSHYYDSTGYEAWWDVMVPLDKWTEEALIEALNAISSYRKTVQPYV